MIKELLNLKNITLRRNYISGRHDLAQEFFVPILSQSIRYDRGVGFFSTGWIKANAAGLANLAFNGGSARWVTSPILSQADLAILEKIENLDLNSIITQTLLNNVSQLQTALEQDTLNTFAWMVADNLLQFRFAIPVGELDGDFHDKFGIFYDNLNQRVSFLGSYNDTLKGLRNYESIRVFFDWEEAGAEIVDEDEQRFDRIWKGLEPNLRIFDLPRAVKQHILELRNDERPYKASIIDRSVYTGIMMPDIFPREYQLEAIKCWEDNGRRGILDMATGTGKTVTALTAITRCNDAKYIIIAAPTQGLVTQWLDELRKLEGLRPPIIEVSANNSKWRDEVFSRFRVLGAGLSDERPFVFVGTYHSFASEDFLRILNQVDPEKFPGLLVADEVHHLGAKVAKKLMDGPIQFRLGLTATLERAFDEEGTQALDEYFSGVVYRLTLAEAIGPILCHYRYDITFAELTENEFTKYQELAAKIARINPKGDDAKEIEKVAELLLIQRARIAKLAENKLEVLRELIKKISLHRCLIYCADLEQVAAVQHLLGEFRIPNLPYTSEQSHDERTMALGKLGRNEISVVVAVDCLDEGVDVPEVHQAILLASSTNTRQFIQRRGRILRKAPGKKKAHLIDILTVPPHRYHEKPPNLLYNELRRAKLLAEVADNQFEAETKLIQEFEQFNIPIEDVLNYNESLN